MTPSIPAHGRSFPLGATPDASGTNFCVFSKHATSVQLLLFARVGDATPTRVIDLDPRTNRTYHYWHAFVPGIGAGQLYGYRVDGPCEPGRGLRFDAGKLLLDPYAKCVARPDGRSREAARRPGDNAASAHKGVVADTSRYDWEDDEPPRRPFAKTIIYEMHVGAFTRHPSSGVPPGRRGTFAGLVEKIPYLQDLGISAVELLPVFAFDEQDAPPGLVNDWGYSPLSFFAPHPAYSSRPEPLAALDEFRDMVKALHRAGIEVILDVVYNHSAEGGEDGATLSLRGFANDTYYLLGEDRSTYLDYSGCGNTLNANEPIVRRMILDSLRYWVSEMHVDGFRFDLASVLSRDARGQPMVSPPVLWDIESDPVLANVKLIAEAWDAAGLYQVGAFIGDAWKEWNGKFRDDVRAFLKGDADTARTLAYRLTGSPDLYQHKEREPEQSINFVACHDGFTLNDVVSYNAKHNEANREANRDGADYNASWNCGVEGETSDPDVERLRNRQVKNFLTLTLLATGTPMLLMGDEVRRTQRGNNNAYCQDNEISWFDWSLVEKHGDILRFTRRLIAIRMARDLPIARLGMTLNELLQQQPVIWHGVRLGAPDWGGDSHSLAGSVAAPGGGLLLHVIANAYWEPLEFELPVPLQGYERWRRGVDTFADPPHDISTWANAMEIDQATYLVQPRTVVVLVARALAQPHAGG
jgi:isoamylase